MILPRWTFLAVGIATIVYLLPSLGDALIYDRASIQAGEWWRLLTGNWVHLSDMHFISDVIGLLVIGSMLEQQKNSGMWLVYLISGIVIGMVIFLCLPTLQFFGGLSGIVTATLVYFCLTGLIKQGAWRRVCLSLLVMVALKIAIEFMLGVSILSSTNQQSFIPVPASHLSGAASALLVFALTRFNLFSK
jgi:rhomboid family GlyGly-CTERM serine protease